MDPNRTLLYIECQLVYYSNGLLPQAEYEEHYLQDAVIRAAEATKPYVQKCLAVYVTGKTVVYICTPCDWLSSDSRRIPSYVSSCLGAAFLKAFDDVFCFGLELPLGCWTASAETLSLDGVLDRIEKLQESTYARTLGRHLNREGVSVEGVSLPERYALARTHLSEILPTLSPYLPGTLYARRARVRAEYGPAGDKLYNKTYIDWVTSRLPLPSEERLPVLTAALSSDKSLRKAALRTHTSVPLES